MKIIQENVLKGTEGGWLETLNLSILKGFKINENFMDFCL